MHLFFSKTWSKSSKSFSFLQTLTVAPFFLAYSRIPENGIWKQKLDKSWIIKSFSDAAANSNADATHKIVILDNDYLGDSWTTSESLENHQHPVILQRFLRWFLKMILKIYVFLAAVESAVVAAVVAVVASASASRFKDFTTSCVFLTYFHVFSPISRP